MQEEHLLPAVYHPDRLSLRRWLCLGYHAGDLMAGCNLLQVAFSYNLMDELVPLYASAAVDLGGLKLAPSSLAIPLIAAGPIMIAFSFWGFPPLERAMGTLTTMRWSLLAAAPLNLLVPMTSTVAGNTPAVLSWLAASFCLIRVVATSVFTCSMVLVIVVSLPSYLDSGCLLQSMACLS